MKYRIKNGAVCINGEYILKSIDFEVNDNSKIGITGLNGSGKTTFLKSLINEDMLTSGISGEKFSITKIGEFNIGYISQIVLDESLTLDEFISEVFFKLISIEEELNKLENNMDFKSSDKYADLLNQYQILGGYTYKKEYEIMKKKFGFKESDVNKKLSEFSGGEKNKIAFMKLLLSKPNLLILDEPTNNLDIETIEWLEEYLKSYKGAFIIVSHDQMFLNKLVNVIYDIENGVLNKYIGNYDTFLFEKEKNYQKLVKKYDEQQHEIARLNEIYEKFRNKPTKASMALSKLKQIERMDKIDKPVVKNDRTFKTKINDFDKSSKNILKMNELSIGYRYPLFFISQEIKSGDKIAIIGSNGVGKSTLIKTICGKINPISGYISYGLHVTPAYFDQNLSFQDENNTILDEFLKSSDISSHEARTYLASFLFYGDDVYKTISVLSGGEKVRLKLALIFINKPNFLILDEVTNHMDLENKKYLEELLSSYEGTILFISHDRHFIDAIANKMIIIKENSVDYFNGNYSEYKNTLKNDVEVLEISKEKKNNNKSNVYVNQKEIKKIEREIDTLENKIKMLENSTFEKENYEDYVKLNEINNNIEVLKEELSVKISKWEELILENEKSD